jgi:hypothetical protein
MGAQPSMFIVPRQGGWVPRQDCLIGLTGEMGRGGGGQRSGRPEKLSRQLGRSWWPAEWREWLHRCSAARSRR